MAYLKQEVLLFKQEANTFATDSTTITEAYNIQLETGKSDKKDVFKFKINNPHNKYSTGERKFEVGDNVKIRFWKNASTYDTATDTNKTSFDGIITEPPLNISDKGHVLTIKGYSRVDLMFSSLIFVKKDNLTIPQIIKKIIDEVNSDNLIGSGSNKLIKYVYNGLDQDGNAASPNTITNVDSTGTTFTDIVQIREIYRKGIELIKKYSSPEFTGDGSYEYYLDENNQFHWTFKSISTTTGSSLTEGTNPQDIDIKISKDDIVNALIINVGMSPSNRGNTIPLLDPSSITKNGAKWKFISKLQNLSETIMSLEETANPDSFDTNQDRFPTVYPYTTNFKSSATFPTSSVLNLPSATKDASIVVNNYKEYDAVIRREAEYQGQIIGQKLLDLWSNPRFQAEVQVKQSSAYTITDLIPHNIPSYNFAEKNLRLQFLNHTIWVTELKSLEDEEDAGEV